MPALRTRDVNPAPTSASASAPSPTSPQDASQTQTLTAPALQLISPTPRTLLFPTSHSLSLGALDASPYSSPSHSPFQGADGYEQYDAGFDNGSGGYDAGNGGYDNGSGYEGGMDGGGGGMSGGGYGAYDKYEGQSATFTFTSQTNDSQASLSFYAHPQANGSSASFHSQSYHIESPPVSHSTTQHTTQHTAQHTAHSTAQHVSHFTQQKAGSQLSLTIPELPSFAPYSASPSDPSSDTASLRSASPSGSIHSHKRRKSTSTTRRDASTERRPKKGDADYVKRPENAFILFRRAACEERQAAEAEAQSRGGAPAKKQRQADLSKAISERWRSLSGEEKRVWEERAKEKKEEHAKANPGYVYRPERKSKKSASGAAASSGSASTSQRRSSLSRARRGSEDSSTSLDSPHLSVFVPMRMPSSHSHHHAHSASVSLSAGSSLDAPHLQSNGGGVHRNGRSSSAPRPYHRIDVPLVNHGMGIGLGGRFKREGSEPTSPSLVPLINEHSRQGGGWDYVPPTKSYTLPGAGSSEYPSMSMVSSLFQQNANAPASAPANGRKSSAPSPLQQIAMHHSASASSAPPSGRSPLSLIAPPPNTVSSTLTSKAPLDSISTTNGNGNNANGGSDGSSDNSGNSSPQTGPFTPSALGPSAFMMPNFETLLEPPSSSTFDGLIDPSLQDMPSSHMRMNMSDGGMGEELDPMGMTGIEGMDDYGMGMGMGLGMGMGMSFGGGMGGVGAFGSWDWPAGEGTLDNNWDVNSIPLASLSPSSLSSPPLSSSASLASPPNSSSLSPPPNSNSNSNGGNANGSATSQLAAQFGSMGVGNGNGKGVGAYDHGEGMYGTMGDPTLMVGGYDDILAGGAFA